MKPSARLTSAGLRRRGDSGGLDDAKVIELEVSEAAPSVVGVLVVEVVDLIEVESGDRLIIARRVRRRLIVLWEDIDIRHIRHVYYDQRGSLLVNYRVRMRSRWRLRWWLSAISGPSYNQSASAELSE